MAANVTQVILHVPRRSDQFSIYCFEYKLSGIMTSAETRVDRGMWADNSKGGFPVLCDSFVLCQSDTERNMNGGFF